MSVRPISVHALLKIFAFFSALCILVLEESSFGFNIRFKSPRNITTPLLSVVIKLDKDMCYFLLLDRFLLDFC